MRGDLVHEMSPIIRPKIQTVEQATDNDHQCWRFDAHGDNAGVVRSVLHSQGISDVFSMVNEPGNDQHCEYDVDKSWEWKEHRVGIHKERWIGII